MADDPFADYVPPGQKQGADPFAGYSAPVGPQAPGAVGQGAPAQGWRDYLLNMISRPASGEPQYLAPRTMAEVNQNAQDFMRAATDTASFGYGDRLNAYLAGTDLSQERAATEQAQERLGTAGNLAASFVGYAPYAGLGAAAKVGGWAAPVIGRWAGGVLGSAAEGAAAGAAGALGHDENIGTGALVGGALGAAGGVPGGVVGRGGKLAPAASAADLEAAKTAAYAPLEAMVFHGPSQIQPALDVVDNGMSGYERDLAKSTMAQVNKLRDQNLVTGSDIQAAQRQLGKVSRGAQPEDRNFAPQFSSALEDVMQNAAPYGRNLTPGKGMSLMLPGPLGGTGFAAGDAAAARDAGDQLYGRLQDLQRLQGWESGAKVTGGPDVGSQARTFLLSDEGQKFAPSGSPQYDALDALSATARPPQFSATPTAWDIRHFAAPLVTAGAGGLFGATTGQDPSHIAEETAVGLGLGYGLHKLVPAVQSSFQRAAQQRALDAARVALSTGQQQAPVLPDAPFRDAVRRLIFGQGAAGAY